MSNREKCVALLDDFSEDQLINVATMLQAMKQAIEDATEHNIPNDITVSAMRELESGGGELWTGSTEDLFAMLDKENEPNA